MQTELSKEQLECYDHDGFLVIENFLSFEELERWRSAVSEAIAERNGKKMPSRSAKQGEDDGINKDEEFFGKVFEQMINLWQTNENVRNLMLDERIGEMIAKLAGWNGTRIWHDQALIKKPWANATSWHLDTPFWSFTDRSALSIWVALDDSTYENGCLYFIPGSHKITGFENTGIGRNMDTIFDTYPQMKSRRSVAVPMKAGSCSFHNGLTIHGAGPNMTNGYRGAMTCAYMPDGAVYNGIQNILSDEQIARLSPGDQLNWEDQNPLIYKK